MPRILGIIIVLTAVIILAAPQAQAGGRGHRGGYGNPGWGVHFVIPVPRVVLPGPFWVYPTAPAYYNSPCKQPGYRSCRGQRRCYPPRTQCPPGFYWGKRYNRCLAYR